MNLATDNGDVILYADDFDLKVASDRSIYVRFHTGDKPKKFRYIGRKLEHGFTKDKKEKFLMMLRMKMVERLEAKRKGEEKKDGQDKPKPSCD